MGPFGQTPASGAGMEIPIDHRPDMRTRAVRDRSRRPILFGIRFAQPCARLRTNERPGGPPRLRDQDSCVGKCSSSTTTRTARRSSASSWSRRAERRRRRRAARRPSRPWRTTDYSVLITDLRMPGMGGMDLIREVAQRRVMVTTIVTTAFGSIDRVVEAMRLGRLRLPHQADRPDEPQDRHGPRPEEAGLAGRGPPAPPAAQGELQLPQHHQQEPGDARDLRADPPHRRDQEHGPDRGGDRHRQGADRQGRPLLRARTARAT